MTKTLPTVAIVGQTNVGKSSLFNRIVGEQRAIVAREEGTTRDNVVEKISHGKHAFWLVDTAGLKDPEDEFEANIQEQITEAAEAADVILVVLDSTKPMSHEDRDVAKRALKSKKPVLLVLNKVDLKGNLPNEEFVKLGIKTIIRTSAEHGQGTDELLKGITEIIPPAKDTKDDDTLRIALIGRPNVGKSNLFNALGAKQQALVSARAGTTRDVNRLTIRYEKRSVEILDTAGIRKSGKIGTGIEHFSVLRSMQAIEQADVCLLLMDVNELHTQLDQKLAGIIKEAGKGLVLVVSKWDSFEDKDAHTRDNLARRIAFEFDFVPWAPLVFTSAVTGQNVSKLFELSAQIDKRRRTQVQTAKLNKVLSKCLAQHPPAGLKNRHPKLRYLVQSDTRPPWFILFGANLGFLHWSYKRYLERELRDEFDFSGTAIMISYRSGEKRKQT